MISTKINVDTSQMLKAFALLEKEGKTTAEDLNKIFADNIKVEVNTNDFKKVEKEAETTIQKIKSGFKGSLNMESIFNFSAGNLVADTIQKGLGLIVEGFNQAIEKGSEFEKQLNAVGAITGQTGTALDNLGESALELSTEFGGSVNAQLGAFQGILSKFGAELANTPKALEEVTRNVNLLAKAGGLDATQAMNALTDAMLQFGVDVTNPNEVAKESARFMNLLAASAKVGAAEIPELTESMLQVGVSAKSAGISAEEVTGAIQRLAIGGKKGSEAGIGLRNVLGLLQKQSGEGEKVLEKMGLTTLKLGESLGKDGLAKTLDLVKNGLNNFGSQTEKNQAILQLFGAENSTVAGLLLENTKQITEFTKASTGTASGLEQAKINMQGFSESMSRLKASIDAGLIKSFMVVKQAVADAFVFLRPLLELWWEFTDATSLTFYSNVFSTAFGIVKSTFMDTYNSIKELIDAFNSLFGGTKDGIDIMKVLSTTFEVLGRIIGTVLTLGFQTAHKIIQAFLYVIKEVILFVKGLGDRFNEFVKSNKMVSDFVEAVTEKFRQLGEFINKGAKAVTNFLQSIGLLSKEKDKNIDVKVTVDDTAIKEYQNQIKQIRNESSNISYKELKEKQDFLANEINEQVKLNKLKSADAEKLKKDLYAIQQIQKGITNNLGGGKKSKIKVSAEIETFEVSEVPEIETSAISIRPQTLKVLTPIKTILPEISETETDKMFKNLGLSLSNSFASLDYSNIFQKRENAVNESLENDSANLLTSLQKNELSYEEYSERLNEIDKQRRQTQKESNNAFVEALNLTLVASLTSAGDIVKKSLIDSVTTSADFVTAISNNWDMMAVNIGISAGQMVAEGQNAFKAIGKAAFDMLQQLVPIFSAQILGYSLATPQSIATFGAWGLAQWAGLTALLQGAVSIARSQLGFKDGVINLQGAGTGTSDSINARLSAGESVITAKATQMNEPFLRFANNGGDLGKLFNMNINNNNSNLESLMIENNNILRSKNLSVNNVNKFNVSSKNISIVRGR